MLKKMFVITTAMSILANASHVAHAESMECLEKQLAARNALRESMNLLDELDRLEVDPDTHENQRGRISDMKAAAFGVFRLRIVQYSAIRSNCKAEELPAY